MTEIPEGWSVIGRGGSLFRRFEFPNYAATSAFLDRLAKLSERTGRYPDLNFASRHVNVTIHLEGQGKEAAAEAARFAREVTELMEGGPS
ncbi:MAG: 4a-hydroxytetrahydrobiopterin dehydratase [Acetobacteraceae bacterium]|nr:4a-hydroxytetrahydrobiopterin dehydratase [Acetobacteraceae bacterium]